MMITGAHLYKNHLLYKSQKCSTDYYLIPHNQQISYKNSKLQLKSRLMNE